MTERDIVEQELLDSLKSNVRMMKECLEKVEEIVNKIEERKVIGSSSLSLEDNFYKSFREDSDYTNIRWQPIWLAMGEWKIRDLVYSSREELLNMRGIGSKTVDQIFSWMEKNGLSFIK